MKKLFGFVKRLFVGNTVAELEDRIIKLEEQLAEKTLEADAMYDCWQYAKEQLEQAEETIARLQEDLGCDSSEDLICGIPVESNNNVVSLSDYKAKKANEINEMGNAVDLANQILETLEYHHTDMSIEDIVEGLDIYRRLVAENIDLFHYEYLMLPEEILDKYCYSIDEETREQVLELIYSKVNM